jgi:hypothetical protein
VEALRFFKTQQTQEMNYQELENLIHQDYLKTRVATNFETQENFYFYSDLWHTIHPQITHSYEQMKSKLIHMAKLYKDSPFHTGTISRYLGLLKK